MKHLTMAAAVVSLIAWSTALTPQLKADEWNQLTYFTFNQPVEIPGQVLPAGTYTFKLLDSQSDRNIVQIFNKDQTKIYATILAIPDYRLQPTGKTVVTFEERAANAPEAIKAWFYPGDNYGQEFVYPRVRAIALAQASNQPVPSMPENLESNTKMSSKSVNEPSVQAMKNAPVKEEQPAGGEVAVGQVITTPPQLVAKNTAPQTESTPSSLPQTASDLPLVGLIGLCLLGSGSLLRFAGKRIS